MQTLTLINGNHKPYTVDLPEIHILSKYINNTALAHIEENTGLEFVKHQWGYKAQPSNHSQIAALFLTYNFKTQYNNNASHHNTLMLKLDHHTGFNVDSICFDCIKHNNIHTGDLKEGDRLAC